MPHPDTWIVQNSDRKVQVDRKTAIAFLQSYESFGSEVIAAFDDWIREIELCSTM